MQSCSFVASWQFWMKICFSILFSYLCVAGLFSHLGCFADNDQDRAIPTMEGTHSVLKGSFLTRKQAIEKCGEVTKGRGWTVFAIQDGGWCGSSAIAHLTYSKYGHAQNCVGGKGGMFANDVYIINGSLEMLNVPCVAPDTIFCVFVVVVVLLFFKGDD